jgi:hypothetical protein
MARHYDAHGDLDWSALTEDERRDECMERGVEAMAPFGGEPITVAMAEAMARTLIRVQTVIELEEWGMRRDYAEALADGN